MPFMRLLVGAGLFAFGYYLGRQSCRAEQLHAEFESYENTEPVANNPTEAAREKNPGDD